MRARPGEEDEEGADGGDSEDVLALLPECLDNDEGKAWASREYWRLQTPGRRRRLRTPLGARKPLDEFEDSSDEAYRAAQARKKKHGGRSHAPHCENSPQRWQALLNNSRADTAPDSNTPWWLSVADAWPHLEAAREERQRVLQQGNASFALFEALGRRLCQHSIPLAVPPHLIPHDWYVDEYLGSALGGYTDRLRLLLSRAPIHVDVRGGDANMTALLFSAIDGRYNTARALLAAGVSLHTVLHAAPFAPAAAALACISCVFV